MTGDQTEVIVVGGGLAGLTAAVFLAIHGTRVTVVEQRDGTLVHPRARTINPRTAEIFRQAGLEEEIRGASSYVRELPSVLRLRADTLAGPEQHRVEERPPADSAGGRQVSPSRWAMIDQDRLEGLLLSQARELGADIRFGTRLEAIEPDATGVTARLAAAAGPAALRGRYLIGADGYRSRVRELCGIPVSGPGVLGRQVSMVFEADLAPALRGRHDPGRGQYLAVAHLAQPRPGTVLSPYGESQWVLYTPYDPAADGEVAGFGPERCTEIIRAATGLPDLRAAITPQLADGSRVLSYDTAAYVAGRFRAGPVFLAGDAAHAMPPAGAFGAGTGIQDAHNLAWKLALVLAGSAGEGLLESYERERRPVAAFTLGQALRQMREFNAGAPRFAEEGPVVEYDATVFGYRYPAGPAAWPAGQAAPGAGAAALPPRELTGQPGTRAPHVAAGAGSTLDWYGRDLVLLTAGPDERWQAAGTAAAAALGVPLRIHRLARAGPDAAAAHGLPGGGAMLVRPDGFVGWRAAGSPAGPGDPAGLEHALRALLSRPGPGAADGRDAGQYAGQAAR
jgi:putative polyketide hydroxylase